MDDLEKHVLEQAKIEVEHTRSWPTKILAFYVAINAAVVTGLFTLAGRSSNARQVPEQVKLGLVIAVLGLAVWACALLVKNHKNYLRNRNLQVHFQKANAAKLTETFPIPADWLVPNEIRLQTRWEGWTFYASLIVFVAALGVAGICAS
jgi:high-affinity Fe2+/Pb2+ permease